MRLCTASRAMGFQARRCPHLRRAPAACSPTNRSTRSFEAFGNTGRRPTHCRARSRRHIPPPNRETVHAGLQVYATYCQSCHGIGGRGGQRASSIVDGSFLALLSDQELRTIVIVGRPELGAPDWRSDLPGKPLSAEDVSDVVAWLASQRPQFPGQPYTGADKSIGETP